MNKIRFLRTLIFAPIVIFNDCWSTENRYFDLIIIGGGVAGYSAAIYGGNARMRTAVCVGPRAGGQLAVAGVVENMPGILPQYGYAITEQLENQAKTFGAQIFYETIEKIIPLNTDNPRFKLITQEGTDYYADALIIATGSKPRMLGVPGEWGFWGKGVSTCAVCDCTLAQDKDVVIIGGGDSAIEEALQLVPYARSITILLRGNTFRASPRMQEKLMLYKHISYRYHTEVQEIFGDQKGMQGVKVYNKIAGTYETVAAQALFLAIGQIPETDFIHDLIECDRDGYIKIRDCQKTSVKGIFAAGDVADGRYRQAVVASGDGAKAALEAIAYLRGID